MISGRPCILLYCARPDQVMLREICAGIEEEGVLYEIYEDMAGDLDTLAWEAAGQSMLGTGIGIIGTRAAMQMRSVPKGKNVFQIEAPKPEQARKLGANSARAVKRNAFKEM